MKQNSEETVYVVGVDVALSMSMLLNTINCQVPI